jgi:hypothetical protein
MSILSSAEVPEVSLLLKLECNADAQTEIEVTYPS